MKIIRLSLNNLASLAGTHHINFESSPLAYAGLIAITGKTGSGKSTLLDAMCLALYNEIPRLKGATGSLKDAGGQDVSIKDTKNILRRGCVQGFAELEFIALDQKRYTARWEIRRARQKVDGNLKVERAITCLDDQRVLNQKISECTPLIEKLVGLSFEQFTRAVLLAQSEVGAFLKAKDNERADLLEYLTNSQIFSLVSQKAFEKHSEVKQKRADLEKQIGYLELLSETDIATLEQQHTALKQVIEHFNQSEKVLDNDLKWHRQQHYLYTEIQAKKEIYMVQLDAEQKMAPQQQLLEQLDQFQQIREQFVQQQQLHNQRSHFLAEQHSVVAEFSAIQQQRDTQQQKLLQLQQQQQQQQQEFQKIKPYLDQGLKLDHELQSVGEQYKQLAAEQQTYKARQIQPVQEQILRTEQQLQQLQLQSQQIQAQLEQQKFLAAFDHEPQATLQRLQEYQALREKFMQQSPAVFQAGPAELQQQQQRLAENLQEFTQRYTDLEQLEQQLQQLQSQQQQASIQQLKLESLIQAAQKMAGLEAESQQLNSQLQQHQNTLKQLTTELLQLQQQRQEAEQSFEQLQQMLAQQRLLQAQSVQELRAQLRPDEACMVCGSHKHPFVQHQELLENALQQLHDQQLQEAQEKLQQQTHAWQQAQIQQSQLHTLIEQQQQRNQQLTTTLAQQKFQLHEEMQHFGWQVNASQNTEQLQQQLGQHAIHLQQEQQQLAQQLQTQQGDWKRWRQQQQQLDQLRLSMQQYLQLEQMIQPVLAHLPESLQNVWVKDTGSSCQQLSQQLQQRQQQSQEFKTLETHIQNLNQQLEKARDQLILHQHHEGQLQQKLDTALHQGKALREQLNSLTLSHAGQSYRTAQEWRDHLEQQQHILDEQLRAQQLIAQQHEQHLQQAELKKQSISTQIQQLQQQIEQCQQAIQHWQSLHTDFNHEHIQQCLNIDLQQHQQIRQQLQLQHQTVENAKTAWQILEEQYQHHLKSKPELSFEEVELHLNKLAQEKAEQQNAFNEVDTKLRIHVNNQVTLQRHQHQIEQVKAEEYRWGRIYDLIGHKEGSKFQKIAQEHHLDILVEYANQQLQPLAPRYQLYRIPDSLSLAIIDLDMNSEVRPVLSLSGGETFLVSLALALAIANMASGSMKLESLFIDEGFGTLDPASLHMVMNALDHLQSQGRKVVLISHVQEMHERIPVQIQVKPVGAGASTIEIIG
ncbi:MAG TPA: AAA family ATPase [Acinetobacter lwoffii]|uniref:AAA family ATPase n=1 Tax=Acinetobacter lwoffii TaxID=28090 RepID=A0A9D2UU49_ACILW|nr:AAA family ATPase [Acinetobacter sp. 10FS3-1]MDM1782562.1 AAA family ATPase [Acinetobacter indicus]QKQ69393.1 hypothetical protein E5Y90_03590 [Acinetobacter sp. 10FS3-1]HJF28770.1 AAA family ATPase [Acinetobacter lwoffii]